MFVAKFLVLDAIDQRQPLATIDRLGGEFNELLWVSPRLP